MTIPPAALTEHDDRWILPFRGLTVSQIQVDFAFGLVFDDLCAVRISNTATLGWVNVAEKPEKIVLDPGRQDVAAALVLFNAEVKSAVAFKSGALRIVFGDGHLLQVKSDPDCEAWTVTGPDGMLMVSLPGSGLAVWRSRS
ncbi:DUF6188 family protein [Actinoplanes sp. NPDC051411]|uniref:DUF6188 family protein n=1 Tax=Actinoplanes sp. NPDC051411 TaxID=3155522 RepID=UPI0034412017